MAESIRVAADAVVDAGPSLPNGKTHLLRRPALHRPARAPEPRRPAKHRRLGPLALATGLLQAGLAFAQDATLDRAAALLAAHDAPAAYALLDDQENARAGDPAFDRLFGIAALDAGHLTRSIFAFERVLALRPGDAEARAELARALLAAGEIDRARDELREARRAEMPDAAAAAIDRVLGAIDQVAPSRSPKTVAYVEVGGGRDTNVNAANNAGEFALPAFGGLLFTVAPGDRRHADTFGAAAAGVSTQWPIDAAWSLVASADGRGVANRQAHEANTGVVDVSLGVTHVAGAHAQTLALQSSTAWLSSSRYRSANGVGAQWQTQLGKAAQASVFGQWSRQEYAGEAERNTDRAVLGLGGARNVDATGTLGYGSVYLADEHARHDGYAFNGHRGLGVRVGAEQQAGPRAVGFAEWQWERRHYGGTDPLFNERRREHQNDLLAGVRVTLAPGWQLSPQLRRTNVESSIALYQYRRTVVQLVLRKEFR